jgi:hypothetical protein
MDMVYGKKKRVNTIGFKYFKGKIQTDVFEGDYSNDKKCGKGVFIW